MSIRNRTDLEYSQDLNELIWEDGSIEIADLFAEELEKLPLAQEMVKAGVMNPESMQRAIGEATVAWQGEVTFPRFIQTLKRLFLSNDLVPTKPEVAPAPKKAAAEQRFEEYEQFSASHNSSECAARARQDSGYAAYRRSAFAQESATEHTEFNVANAKSSETKAYVPVAVSRFVAEYNAKTVAQARQMLLPGVVGAAQAKQNQLLFNQAVEMGLI